MIQLKLGPVVRRSGQNRYCGPAVISALTGRSTQDASRLIRHYNGKPLTMGTSDGDLLKALSACGIHATPYGDYGDTSDRPTLSAWLETMRDPDPQHVYLVSAGHHWQLVQGDSFVCGQTRKVVPVTHKKVHRRARVKRAWVLVSYGNDPDLWPKWWPDC